MNFKTAVTKNTMLNQDPLKINSRSSSNTNKMRNRVGIPQIEIFK